MIDEYAEQAANEIASEHEYPMDLAAVKAVIAKAIQDFEDAQWVKPSERLPSKPGKSRYEYVDCLIVYDGRVIARPWNCEHSCFDDEERDDFFCNAEAVEYWREIPKQPNANVKS